MERIPGYRKMTREEIVSDLKSRLHDLRKNNKYKEAAEIDILAKSLRIEKAVLKAESRDVSDFFTTGFAGRRAVLWNYIDGHWSGQLVNPSGVVKKEGTGNTAEVMLRQLLPAKYITSKLP